MKKQWKIIIIGIAITICTILLVSCSAPDSNSTETEGPASPSDPPTSLQTVEPGIGTPEAVTYPPETGSVLRWVDLSDFVYVPADEFIMGADSLIFTDFRPAHGVSMPGFWIQQAEVTNQQYALCVAAGECTPPFVEEDVDYWYADQANHANKPVVGVSWYQAQEYCTYIEARLPTEAEWEMSARGTEGKNYPWGDDEPTCDLLNFNDCLDPSEPEEVRKYNNGTSPFEAMDMSGNVFEWVADWYQEDYYPDSPDFNPPGPLESELQTEDKEKVFRGGGYATSLEKISPILRFKAKPEEHAADLGFRCVLLGEGVELSFPAPACQVAALAKQPESGPTVTPKIVQQAEGYSYCSLEPNGDHKITMVLVNNEDMCFTKRMKDFSINIPNDTSAITCNLDEDAGCGVDKVYCTSPHFFEGATVGINFCYYEDHNYEEYYGIPECAPGFDYNTGTGWCEPVSDWLPVPPCPDGYDEVGDLGCLPSPEGFEGCPVGYYTLTTMNSIVCIPLDECLLPGAPESCAALVCPPGQSYDTDDQCCVAPEPLKAICPIGWYLDPDLQMCVLPTLIIADCQSVAVTIPYCPTPTVPPPVYCSNLNESICKNTSGCEWVDPSVIPGYCRAE